jgi:hypothetical protein
VFEEFGTTLEHNHTLTKLIIRGTIQIESAVKHFVSSARLSVC